MEQRSSLTPSVSSAAQARSVTRTVLSAWNLTELEELACLLVTELVTNVVLHAATTSELAFSLECRRLRVSVADRDPRPPVLRQRAPWATAGRGLALVDALADDWGWELECGGDGKAVWFDLHVGGGRCGVRPPTVPRAVSRR